MRGRQPIQVVPQKIILSCFEREKLFWNRTFCLIREVRLSNPVNQEEKQMKRTTTAKFASAALAASLLFAGCSSSPNSASSSAKGSSTAAASNESYQIGLAQLVDHPSLNTIREAFLDELEDEGYTDGENVSINYQNAAGKTSSLDSIMSSYKADGSEVIVAIATPTAMSAQNYSTEIPVVFSAVSDPVGAGLVESLEKPGGNITGTSDEVQVEQIVDLMLELSPEIHKVGVLYNTGEANSVSNVKRFKDYAREKGLEVVERTGTDNTTMQQAAVELASSVDAMFSPNDNTVATGMASLGQVAADAGIPYYVGADSMVQTGGFATVGIDYEELGRETARMAIDVLNGKSPADMPVKVFKDNLNIYVNEELLNKLSENGKTKVALPEDLSGKENLKMVTSFE